MLSFVRGLVLRKGLRTLEFERDIGNGEVQFKYQDTHEVKTFRVSKLYKEILSKEFAIVLSAQPSVRQLQDEPLALNLPSILDKRQEATIAHKMMYIKAALLSKAAHRSQKQLAKVIDDVRKRGIKLEHDEINQFIHLREPKPSTLMLWLKRYQRSGGNPYVLCDYRPLAHKPKRINQIVETVVQQAISKHYLQLRGKSIKETHAKICEEIANINRRNDTKLLPPGEKTISRRINEIPENIRDAKRFGLAYSRNKWRYSMKGDQSARILERAEIDHTPLDIWVLDPRSGVPIGKPWITVVLDRFSGYILGIYISFYGPSSGTVSKAIRCSILPKDDLIAEIPEIDGQWSSMGVPETYVVDNGLEFHSHAFRRIGWHLRADIVYNPVRQPWLKASVERVMMELNRTLPLPGKVFTPLKNAQALIPSKTAAILFDDLCRCLLIWAAKVHPFHIHPKTLVRPIDLWEEGRQSSPPALLPTDLSPLALAAGISVERTVGSDGIFFQYMRYNSLELQEYRRRFGHTFKTEIRFDPDDLGLLHVNLPKANQWIQVELQRPHFDYGNGLSLLQHALIRKEAGKRLTRTNADEVLLIAQADLNNRWSDAIKRGVKVRKDSDLIRAQGLTSARLNKTHNSSNRVLQTLPEPSQEMLERLPNIMPFKGYSLNEDDI